RRRVAGAASGASPGARLATVGPPRRADTVAAAGAARTGAGGGSGSVACGAGSGEGLGVVSSSSASTLPAPSTSISTSTEPTGTIAPTSPWTAVTTPSTGEVMSTVA